MAWKGRDKNIPQDFAQLLSSLNNSRIQTENNALYQVIYQLVLAAQKNKDLTINQFQELTALIDSISNSIININDLLKFATFWTQNVETVNLPNSVQALAGTGITLDYSVPNKVTISSTGGGSGGSGSGAGFGIDLLPEGPDEPMMTPQGAAGAPGSPGTTGAIGPMGPAVYLDFEAIEPDPPIPGLKGADGAPGTIGATGPVGLGIDGDEGPEGMAIPGIPGISGNPGSIGPQGPAGLGLDGIDGEDSYFRGAQGPQGIQGVQGVQGPQGLGLDGIDGEEYHIPGPKGIDGIIGINGAQGPIGLGLDGDTGDDGFSIPGPQGIQGIQGIPGTGGGGSGVGIPGLDGEPGDDGFVIPSQPGGNLDVPIVVTANTTVLTNYSWVVPESLEIVGGVILEIQGGAKVEILSSLYNFIGIRITNTNVATLTTGILTVLTFNTTTYNIGTVGIGGATRLTAPVDGYYQMFGSCAFASNATGIRRITIVLNNTTSIAIFDQNAVTEVGVTTSNQLSNIWHLNRNDWIELNVRQDSGGNLATVVTAPQVPSFAMTLIQ